MTPLWKRNIARAAPRPLTPYWSDNSGALVSAWHFPVDVDPRTTPTRSQQYIADVLQSKALL